MKQFQRSINKSMVPMFAFNSSLFQTCSTFTNQTYFQSNSSNRAVTMSTTTSIRRRMPIVYSPEFNKHRPPPGRSHPECPERLDVCVKALKENEELKDLIDWMEPYEVKEDEKTRMRILDAIKKVHDDEDYVMRIERISSNGGGGLDADTYVSPDTYEISLLSVSAWMKATDLVLSTPPTSKISWILSRPPGHHATPFTGMGFCIFSNAAIVAKYALNHYEHISKVAILDFDVHHGNGTQLAVEDDERIKFVSSHQFPLYPGSGREGFVGEFQNILNINLEQGTGIGTYRNRFESEMLPFLLNDGLPDLFIVSAGFDALDVDPLAQLDFKPKDYRLFTELILNAIGDQVPIIFGLEGGYNLGENGLSAAVTECISGYCLP